MKIPIDDAVLRRLYLEENLTDTQIAERLGTSQASVSRQRAACGIPTVRRCVRLHIPPLTPLQRSLLIGSMLGDGGLQQLSGGTARFYEHHSVAQLPYLEWKRSVWGSQWASSVSPGNKTVRGTVFEGYRFTTVTHTDFMPWRLMFYPEGRSGSKQLPPELPDLVDSFALAVWYMDDGSASRNSYRISFGLSQISLDVAVRILCKFGLSPIVDADKRTTGVKSIAIQGVTDVTLFSRLISPHVPVCMRHKLLDASCLHAPLRDSVSREDLVALAAVMPVSDAASVLGVSEHTVSRLGAELGVSFRVFSPESAVVELRRLSAAGCDWGTLSVAQQVSAVDGAVALLTEVPFPLPVPSVSPVSEQVRQLRQSSLSVTDTEVSGFSSVGQALCNEVMPHRYLARSWKERSAVEAWANVSDLRAAVRFQLSCGDPVLPHRVLRAVAVNKRTPSNFLPARALALLRYLLPDGGTVLDPCAGYGGRLLAALVGGYRYVGIDAEARTVAGLRKLATLVSDFVTGTADLHCALSEEFDYSGVRADLVLTSPPYFNQERYSEDSRQSSVRYADFETWSDQFLRRMLCGVSQALSGGGCACVICATVRQGSVVYDIPDAVVAAGTKAGFELLKVIPIAVKKLSRSPSDVAVILRRTTAQVHYEGTFVADLPTPGALRYRREHQPFTFEELHQMYSVDLLTDSAIAKRAGLTEEAIRYRRKLLSIPTLTPDQRRVALGQPSLSDLDAVTFERLYVQEKLSLCQIGALYGVSKIPVTKLRNKYGLGPV